MRVDGSLRQFMIRRRVPPPRCPDSRIVADDVTLCLGRIEGVEMRAARERSDAGAPANG